MCVLQTAVAHVKIEVNVRFLCVKVGVAILQNSDPRQVHEIMKNQSFLYQFGVKHRNEYFFLGTFD